MKSANYLGLAAALLLLIPVSALAKEKDKTERNLRLYDAVQVGSTMLQPGHYKVEWKGTGQAVPITFLRDGKSVLSTTAQVVEKKKAPQSDAVVMRKTRSNKERLEELDFGHRKDALLFTPGAARM